MIVPPARPLRVLVAPNAFKGWLDAAGAAAALAEGLRRAGGERTEVACCPVADGGDGTLAVFLAAAGGAAFERRTTRVSGPLGGHVEAAWGWRASDGVALVEMAEASGLRLLGGRRGAPTEATTRGVGELIAAALRAGARRLVVGVGGSATVDGGAGALAALGWRFADAEGRALEPPRGLERAARAVAPPEGGADLPAVEVLCDVTNPLLGPRGAAAVFGPQKGASRDEVALLEARLARLAEVLGGDPRAPGAGAAGGLAFGLAAALRARLVEGAVAVLELLRFRERLAQADVVVTGEGRLDDQTLEGKAPAVVARMARAAGVPCIVACGLAAWDAHPAFDAIVAAPAARPDATPGALAAAAPAILAHARRLAR